MGFNFPTLNKLKCTDWCSNSPFAQRPCTIETCCTKCRNHTNTHLLATFCKAFPFLPRVFLHSSDYEALGNEWVMRFGKGWMHGKFGERTHKGVHGYHPSMVPNVMSKKLSMETRDLQQKQQSPVKDSSFTRWTVSTEKNMGQNLKTKSTRFLGEHWRCERNQQRIVHCVV